MSNYSVSIIGAGLDVSHTRQKRYEMVGYQANDYVTFIGINPYKPVVIAPFFSILDAKAINLPGCSRKSESEV